MKRDPNNEEATILRDAARQKIDQASLVRRVKLVRFIEQPPTDDRVGVPIDGEISVPQGGFDEIARGGDLLENDEEMRRVVGQRLEAEVSDGLKRARTMMSQDPGAAKQLLKRLQDSVLRITELEPSMRVELNSKVSSAIQAASRREVQVRESLAQQSQAQAAASGAQVLIAERRQREQTLQQLVERFNALMAEQQYKSANDDIAPVVREMARGEVIQRVVEVESNIASNQELIRDVIDRRWRGFVDTLYVTEAAPFQFLIVLQSSILLARNGNEFRHCVNGTVRRFGR